MPACGNCGAESSSTAKFCPECGTALLPTSTRARTARKTVSVVFSDLVDSTTLAEELDAESLREVLDEYFDEMRSVLEQHGGVVEKFIGDAVMAVFGLPRMHEDDALRAVRAAVGMQNALTAMNRKQSAISGVRLRSRTGVNTGVVVVADGADGQRLATGDAVNVAARLEQAAPPGGIVLGPDTYRLVNRYVEALAVGPLNLKGKSERIDAWQLVRLAEGSEPAEELPTRPIIGRRSELAVVEAHLDTAAQQGHPASLLLVGEPGVGKSRLAREVVARHRSQATVLSTACQPYGATSFQPLSDLLSGLSPVPGQQLTRAALHQVADRLMADDREAVIERVASLLHLTETVFPLEESFWATGKLLGSLSSRHPLVLVVEDLHWADDSLLALLEHLCRFPHAARTLILSTARPDVLDLRSFDALRATMKVLRLPALSAEECDEVMAGVVGGSSLPGRARALIRRAAEGNPLFVEQALATLIEEGVLAAETTGWTITRPVTEIQVPATISAIFAARLDRLGDDERLVMGAASVAGPTFSQRALRPMLTQLDAATLDGCLARLIRAELLVPMGEHDAADHEIRFEHVSLRDVAYDMLLKSDRAAFHERLADWLAEGGVGQLGDGPVGHHLAEAYKYRAELRHNDAPALQLALRSARHLVAECQRVLRIGDLAGAERLTSRVVELLTACGPPLGRTDLPLMESTAKLLVTMGQWSQAVALLSPYVDDGVGPLLRDLGVARCQLHHSEPQSPGYREGQRLLELASRPPNCDTDAMASLAGTWKGLDDTRAQAYYRQCLDLDPSEPYALGNLLEYEIAASRDLAIVAEMREQVLAARRRCRAQADQGLNLPWAFFDAGKFELLLRHPYQAIASYAKAVQLATAEHMLVTTMRSLDRIVRHGGGIRGSTWARDLLALGRAARFPSEAALTGLGMSTPVPTVDAGTPVVILAGGTDGEAEAWLARNGATLVKGFEGFHGAVVSGGTEHGVSGLAGVLSDRYGDKLMAIGYLPQDLPTGAIVDHRYDALRRTGGEDFSLAESLQSWADLIASGVRPTAVRVLAVNGGRIARAEYRVALGLGCTVGVLVGSGREADLLLEDSDWLATSNLARVDVDSEAISRFLTAEPP